MSACSQSAPRTEKWPCGGDEQKLIVDAAPGRIHVFVVPLGAQNIDPDAGRRKQGHIKIQERGFGGGATIAADDPRGATLTQLFEHIFVGEMQVSDGSGGLQRAPIGGLETIDVDAAQAPVGGRQNARGCVPRYVPRGQSRRP